MTSFAEIINYINYIKDSWDRYSLIKEKWDNTKLYIELHTGGLSQNEILIEHIKKSIFFERFWTKIERGGHYYFEIDICSLGYLKSSDFCKKKNFSRSYLHKIKYSFDTVEISKNKIYYKEVSPPQQTVNR